MPNAVIVPRPDLQIGFARALSQIRSEQLQDALRNTVRTMEISAIDQELAGLVSPRDLSILASRGLRGELLFAVPCVLASNPRLLAYYRLLMGYSQKEFYSAKNVGASFRRMEDEGDVSRIAEESLLALCQGLVSAASSLLAGISTHDVEAAFLDDLTLLTLGPQLRGGANVKRGSDANARVFDLIHGIVAQSAVAASDRFIQVANAAGRKVLIEFAPDPDIVIREEMHSTVFRNVIAIEIKGGKDFSNIHNRLGEAEKSHQKARQKGFVECWTVVNVDAIDMEMAIRESPTTNRFYLLSRLESQSGGEFEDFRSRIISLTGIPSPSSQRKRSLKTRKKAN
jgi:hypothetical protein